MVTWVAAGMSSGASSRTQNRVPSNFTASFQPPRNSPGRISWGLGTEFGFFAGRAARGFPGMDRRGDPGDMKLGHGGTGTMELIPPAPGRWGQGHGPPSELVRVAPPLVLGPEERATLHRWARGVPGRDRRALRARIVLAAADGLQDLEIGRALGVSRLTAARWRHRFLEARLRGIERVAARTPGEGRIPAGRVQGIVRATAQGSSTGPRRVSTRRLARQFGVSHSTVQRVWAPFGVRPSPVEAVPRRPDPVRPWEIRDVVGLYLRPPDHVIALSLGPRSDRAGPLTVLPEPSPAPPLPTPGIVPWGGDAGRPGTTGRASTRQRLRELLRFLGEVERGIGRRVPARIVARLPSLEGEPSLRSWQARRPHVHLEPTGSVKAWRTRALQALHPGGRVPSRRSSYHGRSEVTRSIGLFLSTYS